MIWNLTIPEVVVKIPSFVISLYKIENLTELGLVFPVDVGLEMTSTSKSIIKYVCTNDNVRPDENDTDDPNVGIPVKLSIETRIVVKPKSVERSAKVKIAVLLSTLSDAKLKPANLFSKVEGVPNTTFPLAVVSPLFLPWIVAEMTETGPTWILFDPAVPL